MGEVPGAETWGTYDPTVTWANAENNGLGEIDRPGNYELANRSSEQLTFIRWFQRWRFQG
jgi:hypothetical protein